MLIGKQKQKQIVESAHASVDVGTRYLCEKRKTKRVKLIVQMPLGRKALHTPRVTRREEQRKNKSDEMRQSSPPKGWSAQGMV